MSIAHSAATRFPSTNGTTGINSVDTTTGDRTFSHAGSASDTAVVVMVLCTGTSDVVTGVLYGGVAMTLETSANDTTEAGRVQVFYLVSGVPTGTQTVTLQGCTATQKWAVCCTDTGAGPQFEDSGEFNTTTSANPSIDLTVAAISMAYGAFHSGTAAPPTSAEAECTLLFVNDYGALSASTARWTNPQGPVTNNVAVVLASDDWCGVVIALSAEGAAVGSLLPPPFRTTSSLYRR